MLSAEVLAEIESLLARVRAGELQALDALIAKALPHMKKYISSTAKGLENDLTASDADVLMDAAARAARKLPTFKGGTAPSFLSWLKKIVVHGKIDSDRRKGRKKRNVDVLAQQIPVELLNGAELGSQEQKPNARMDAIETWLTLMSALLELPAKQREPFWLCVICERDRDEVATKLGATRASIGGAINRAREALADVLGMTQGTNSSLAVSDASARGSTGLPMETSLLAGRFEVGPLISAGVVSHVYQGSDQLTGQTVAISMLNYDHCSSAEAVARFINESHWLRSISAPNIGRVLSGGMLRGGRPYLVQEWLPVSLADVLKQGPLSVAAVHAVIHQVVRAITALHACGLIHRDIAPSQFRMARWEFGQTAHSSESVKLANLRLAKPVTTNRMETPLPISTVGGVLPGAVEYRAPELWVDVKQANDMADVYSIGALWFALLTGRPPFVRATNESVQSLMQRCLYEPPPVDLVAEPHPLLVQSLSKAPSARPTIADLCEALSRS
jgi:RNA polymerase sigma factor (sigma-70 family)